MNPGQQIGLLSAAIAFAAALALVPLFRLLAQRVGIVDRPSVAPGGRKQQRVPVPLLGGVAVLLAAAVGIALALVLHSAAAGTRIGGFERVLIAGGLTFLIGLVDDLFKDKVGPLLKFIGQFAAVAVLFGEHYGGVFRGEASTGDLFHVLTTTLWFLTVVNAVNFVDNMDGLCTGLATTSLLVGLFGVGGGGDVRYGLVAGGLGGALLAFLPYNYPRARIYLGDAGSHLVGFFLALLSLQFTAGFLSAESRLFGLDAFIPAMLLLGLPLYDLLFSVVRRYRERRPLFHGDARHLSHRLVGAGLDRASAVMLLWGVHLILAAAGVVALGYGGLGRFATFTVALLFLGLLSAILVRVEHRRQQRRSGPDQPDGESSADLPRV